MKRLIINILKRFLAIVPIVVLFLFMYEQLLVLERENAREKVVSEHTGHLNLMDYMIQNVFEEYYNTLHLIRNSNEMTSYLANPTAETRESVEAFFQRMATNRSYIRGLVFGNEASGPQLALQTFSDAMDVHENFVPSETFWIQMRQEVMQLEEQGFYFSPLMMVPFIGSGDSPVSVVLSGIPVYQNNSISGLIGMLIDGEHILSIVKQFFADHPGEIHFSLIDSIGKTVFSSSPVDRAAAYSVDADFILPEILEQVKGDSSGGFKLKEINFHFRAFDPFREQSSFYKSHDHFLVGVISFSDEDVVVIEDSFLLRNKPLRWVLALFLLVLGGFINTLTYYRKNDRELLAVSNLVSDQSHDGVLITDTLSHVTYCNRTFELMTGLSSDEIMASVHDVYNLDGSRFVSEKMVPDETEHSSGVYSWRGSIWLKGKRHIALTYLMLSRIVNNHGHAVHHVGLYSNPRNLSRESFDQLMVTEHATAAETDQFPLALLEHKRTERIPFLLIYMKLVNIDLIEARYTLEDHYKLGAHVRQRLTKFLQGNDLIIQYSPDTFALTLTVEKDHVENVLKKAKGLFKEPFGLEGQQERIRVRCGISQFSDECQDANTMLRQAKTALAAQDHFDHDGFLHFDESVAEHVNRYYTILHAFDDALTNKAIEVHYQPVIAVETNRIQGAEALVRWNHPTLGFVSPGEFIPIIEQNGLERKLGAYVVEHVARFLHELGDLVVEDFAISMNVCPTELKDSNLVTHMVQTLDTYEVPHEALIIELTERSLLTDVDNANSVLKQLDDEQIRVAIDDFGTGFSSLSYLHELDIDVLKIDRSFIKDYPESDEGIILKAMVGMAKELGITVTVEGVEIPEQLQLLASLGIPTYQGFLYSPAVNAQTFKEMLLSGK